MNDKQMSIQQVAEIIIESPDTFDSYEAVENVNDGDGWSFDVRWPSQQYVSDDNWTRVEGLSLGANDLHKAWDIACREWLRYAQEVL